MALHASTSSVHHNEDLIYGFTRSSENLPNQMAAYMVVDPMTKNGGIHTAMYSKPLRIHIKLIMTNIFPVSLIDQFIGWHRK